jgi:hypothetical protein
MKNKLLHILTLLFFSVEAVHFLFSAMLFYDLNRLLPLKTSPNRPAEQHTPAVKNKYTPQDLNRIYLFEHIHKSIERGKKGTTS